MRNQSTPNTIPGFRSVPRTGVIYVMTEASQRGYKSTDPLWSNLGQGAPETGIIPGCHPRITSIDIREEDYEYSGTDGVPSLRAAIADLYNLRYRQGRKSKYTAENVAICSGGRLALTRAVSTLGQTHIGHLLPDYTAYEELLGSFRSFVPIPILPSRANGYLLSLEELEREILGRGLSSLLLSNPANPTGQIISGSLLEDWMRISRQQECSFIFDEFYSHYIYDSPDRLTNSAAEFVENVDRDPVLILDGLTKNWRYPGFRIAWTLGPKNVIEAIASAGSFLDGGPPQPMQRAALPLVSREIADAEARSIQSHFREKRDYLVAGLRSLGIVIDPEPKGGFYCWGDLSKLPPPLNEGMGFFQAALEAQVIVVPGEFFDINPGKRRPERQSRFHHFARFSFGPSLASLEGAIDRMRKMIAQRK